MWMRSGDERCEESGGGAEWMRGWVGGRVAREVGGRMAREVGVGGWRGRSEGWEGGGREGGMGGGGWDGGWLGRWEGVGGTEGG